MFDIAFLILFSVMAVRIAKAVSRESAIFREFNQSRALAIVVFLFPLGPIVLLVGSARLGLPLPFVLSAACFIPALILAQRNRQAFERAGTDRVKKAQGAVLEAFGIALAGLIYVSVLL